MRSAVLQEDLQIIAQAALPWEKFRGCTFLVTGATGLIGSLFVRSLLAADRAHALGLRILAPVRDPAKAEKIFSDEPDTAALRFQQTDLKDVWSVEGPVDYILHAAAVTASKTMVEHPTEVIRTALGSMERLLELAGEKRVRKMLFLSSMEMYGQVGEEKADETALGWLDLSKVRSCYPESKRMCECMANAWAAEYGVPVCSVRLAQTFGPGILEGEGRVFAQFARSAAAGEDIVLRTKGLSEGNYCYTRDAMRALLLLLTAGQPGEAYNVVNEETHRTIREMAELVAERVAGGKIRVVYDIPEDGTQTGYAADVKLRLDGGKLRALGWEPEVGLEEMYRRLTAELQEKCGR